MTHTALCRLWKESLDSDGQEEFEDTKGVIRIGKLKHTARLIILICLLALGRE